MSTFKNQKLIKPKPEDIAGELNDANRVANILNLVEFIRSKKIGIQWEASNAWALKYKGKKIFQLKIGAARWDSCDEIAQSWHIRHNRLYLDYYYSMEDCELKTFIFEHIYAKACGNCIGTNANPNEQKAGYMNPTECSCNPLRIYNPEGEAQEFTKRLIEFRMNCVLENPK